MTGRPGPTTAYALARLCFDTLMEYGVLALSAAKGGAVTAALEKVAIGVLAALFLTDRPPEMVDRVYAFCAAVGLPTTLEGLGLKGVSDADLMRVAEAACAPGETIHNEPYEVSPQTVFWVIKAADAEGRRRKAS